MPNYHLKSPEDTWKTSSYFETASIVKKDVAWRLGFNSRPRKMAARALQRLNGVFPAAMCVGMPKLTDNLGFMLVNVASRRELT
jgi:hypothetical protein